MTPSVDPTPDTLLRQAEEFLRAAHLLQGRNKRATHLLLVCQGLELAFKAFCLHNGVTLKALRTEFGHDLSKLFDEAQSFELGLSSFAQSSIAFMNDDYVTKALNYLEPRPYYASTEENLEAGLATVFFEVGLGTSSPDTLE